MNLFAVVYLSLSQPSCLSPEKLIPITIIHSNTKELGKPALRDAGGIGEGKAGLNLPYRVVSNRKKLGKGSALDAILSSCSKGRI